MQEYDLDNVSKDNNEEQENNEVIEKPVETKNEETPPKKKLAETIAIASFDYIEMFCAAIIAVLLIFSTLFRLCRVDGPSMENTLLHGEQLIITDFFYEPQYGDIIVFHQTSNTIDRFNEPIVKRVIAKEGDKVDIDFDTWTLYVNDKVVAEDYRKLDGFVTLKADYNFPVTVPKGCLFVMGDNRNNSSDSRDSNIGFVDERRVLGKVILRISPIDRFGSVE